KAMHCMELPYVFNNVARCGFETDARPEAIHLGEIMSTAWLNFARTGNPNGNGVPEWPAYTMKKKATMVFDANNQVRYNHDAELLKVAAEGYKK
ncbi:MAG TPA: carboxylesterase family protein, partial [Prevotella sp.]